jgi:methylornithine synthase
MTGVTTCGSRLHLGLCLQKALEGKPLADEEIVFLLGLEEQGDLAQLFNAARTLRERYFGRKVFLYGFLLFSTWCRNRCSFCCYRAPNKLVRRYRKTPEELGAAASNLADSGVHLLDLTMGEDPFYYDKDGGEERLIDIVRLIKKKTDLPLMISPGTFSEKSLAALAREGVQWFACYQETHNRSLYRKLRLDQDYDYRMEMKRAARKLGFLIEEGILTGIGESLFDLAASFRAMAELGAHQVRVMSFIPQAGTPLEDHPTPPRLRELKIIALLRLLFPDRLIPASLDVDGIEGLRVRMEAGANVVTSLIPPCSGLQGVSNSTLQVDQGYRTAQKVSSELAKIGLTAATPGEYAGWIRRARKGVIPLPFE